MNGRLTLATIAVLSLFTTIAQAQSEKTRESGAAAGWRPLFDGRSLDGWEHVGPGKFVIENGVLRTEGGMGLLWYAREKLGNCVIRVTYKTGSERANSGIYLRIAEQPKDPWFAVHHGFEVQIMDAGTEGRGTGSIYTFSKASTAPAKAGEWNTVEITLRGTRILVAINGTQVNDFDSSELKPDAPDRTGEGDPARGPRSESGFIGLQNHDENSVVYFKDVAVRPLTSSSSTKKATPEPLGLKTLPIRSDAPDFHLPGVDGKTYSLSDFARAKVLAVIFTCNHCPTAQAYEGRIARLQSDYRDKGVAVVAISPNDPAAVRLDELGYTDLADSFDEMKIRAKDHQYNYPYLYDGETQATAKAYGVLATPQVYVFDAQRKLRYVGRFDDGEVKAVKSHDAKNAIAAILEGKPVPVGTTRVFGCSTKWAEKQADARKSLAKWDAEVVELQPIDIAGVAKLTKNDTKKLMLVNLWATWCGPCVAELPELVTMNRMYRGRNFQFVTISLDDLAKREDAGRVLKENHASATNFILNSDDRDKFAEALDQEWPGPVPYTLLIAPGGKIIYRKTGAIDPLELKRAIVGYLGRTY
jgi:thiol-disulfide isomerase/thioredoxin